MPRKPFTGEITSLYGPRVAPTPGASTFHRGLDGVGDGNFAPESGVLVYYAFTGSWGYLAKIIGDSGAHHWLAHGKTAQPLVPIGSRVTEQTKIMPMGQTGTATGDHCHWEVRPRGGDPIDPLVWLSQITLAALNLNAFGKDDTMNYKLFMKKKTGTSPQRWLLVSPELLPEGALETTDVFTAEVWENIAGKPSTISTTARFERLKVMAKTLATLARA